MAEEKIETVLFELLDQKDSGFYVQDTKGTANEIQLRGPSVRWIPTNGFRKGTAKDSNGKEYTTNVAIRFVKNCDEIDRDKQELAKVQTNPREDKIFFKNSTKIISKSGAYVGEFNYLMASFHNVNNPDRPNTATGLFRIVELDKNAELLAEDDEHLMRALEITLSLKTKTGLKDTPFQYNEERIDGLCTLLTVVADTYPQKWYAINAFAKAQPKLFLQQVENYEQVILTEVSHAVKNNVVTFDKNTAIFMDNQKVIKDFGDKKMGMDAKMNALADYLKTEEGNQSLTMLRAKLDFAKNQALQ